MEIVREVVVMSFVALSKYFTVFKVNTWDREAQRVTEEQKQSVNRQCPHMCKNTNAYMYLRECVCVQARVKVSSQLGSS